MIPLEYWLVIPAIPVALVVIAHAAFAAITYLQNSVRRT